MKSSYIDRRTVLAGLSVSGATQSPALGQAVELGLQRPRRLFVTPFDVGAIGDGTYDDGPALQRAYDLAHKNGWQLILPSAIYATKQELNFSKAVTVLGSNWRTSIIKAAAPIRAIMTIGSSSVVQDLGLDGAKQAHICMRVAPGNRCSLSRMRFENTGGGIGLLIDGEMNNSLFTDLMSQGNLVNFLVDGGLNLTFLNCNGNLELNAKEDARSILFLEGRNCRFIGGIFERGNYTNKYEVEVRRGRSIFFKDLEISGSQRAGLGVTGGEVYLRDVHFSLAATSPAVELVSGSLEVRGWTASGKEGRTREQLFKGSIVYV